MATCLNCGSYNRGTAKFCSSCGNQLSSGRLCPNCGTSNSAHAKFCRGCSSNLGRSGSPLPSQDGQKAGSVSTGKIMPDTLVGGRYRIISKIGQGGMGAVYKVSDTRLGDIQCAMKEMSSSAITDPGEKQKAVDAFRQEAQLLSTISHPALPRVTDYFSDGEKQFLIMDIIDGQTLENYLSTIKKPVSEELVVQWAGQLCDVLTYLHTRTPPIIFRDIKPGNIMISKNHKEIKLIDFGIARFFKPGAQKDTMALGTPGYAAPEQYGNNQSDPRSDVYALGATLHYILTLRDPGVQPFKFPSISSLNPRISTGTETIIMRAIEQNPSLRWQSVKEMQNAIISSAMKGSRFQSERSEAVFVPNLIAQQASVVQAHLAEPFDNLHIHSEPGSVRGVEKADLVPRFAAYLLDLIFISILISPLSVYMIDNSPDDETSMLILVLSLFIVVGYFSSQHGIWGKTLGKKLSKIKIVNTDGSKISFWQALWRAILFPVIALTSTFFLIGLAFYLWPIFNKHNRGLHDLLSGTLVVKEK